MKYALLVTMLFSSIAFATTEKEEACKTREDLLYRIHIASLNIANFHTTRTPVGGPFKRLSLDCKNHDCKIIESEEFDLLYAPDHPDAEENGFVKYPNIDMKQEMQIILDASNEIKELEKICR